jgi:hypothetical protein
MIDKQDIEDIYSLSPMQESMLIQYAIDRTTTAYVEQFDFTLRGELDVDRVDGSLNALIAKYAVLRTVFSFGNTETPWQIVLKRRTASAHRADLRDMDPDARVAYVERFKRDDREKGFDLSGGLLLRLSRTSSRSTSGSTRPPTRPRPRERRIRTSATSRGSRPRTETRRGITGVPSSRGTRRPSISRGSRAHRRRSGWPCTGS